jgi:hypothetical protein
MWDEESERNRLELSQHDHHLHEKAVRLKEQI